MKNFEKQALPWEVFGVGVSKEIGTRMKARDIGNCLIVTDKGIVQIGILDPIKKDLEEHRISYQVYDQCVPNCPDYVVLEIGSLVKEHRVDAILAVGGGSSMDAARAGAMVAGIPETITDLHEYGGSGTKMKAYYKPACQVITVATTHATGAEASRSSVVFDTKRKIKYSFLSPNMTPDLAFTDPALTAGMPARPTAITGMDAMAHPLENLIGPDGSSFSDPICISCVERVWQWLPIAVEEPKNLEARSQLCWAAIQGNTNGGTPPGHAVAHAIGARYELVHGHACAVVLPALIRHHAKTRPEKIKILAKIMGVPVTEDPVTIADRVAKKMVKFYKELGLSSVREAIRANGFEDDRETFIQKLIAPVLDDFKSRVWDPPIHRPEDREALENLLGAIYDEE